jgi:Uma2 family endonuclease
METLMTATLRAAPSLPITSSLDVPTLPIYRLSVAQYHTMAECAILTTEDRVELIHGWLVPKMTKRPPHAISTGLVHDVLSQILLGQWHVRTQEPITLDDSEPEPDGALVRGVRRDYLASHPGPADAALVIEVADTSLQYDRTVKRPLYAAARIPVYWIINLEGSQIEVYTHPSGPVGQADYAMLEIFGAADEVPIEIAGQEVARIAVRNLLP